MPLLDHFHPPLRGPRRWEGFHHAWAANIAQHLNREVLPAEFFAESEISFGPTLEIDVANVEWAEVAGGLAAVDAITVFDEDTPRELIAAVCDEILGNNASKRIKIRIGLAKDLLSL